MSRPPVPRLAGRRVRTEPVPHGPGDRHPGPDLPERVGLAALDVLRRRFPVTWRITDPEILDAYQTEVEAAVREALGGK